jgi:hypothetical protein
MMVLHYHKMRHLVCIILLIGLLCGGKADDQLDKFASNFDFAAEKAGAKVIDTSSALIVGADNLLEANRDKYMMLPCKEQLAWVVIQLAEDVTVCRVQIANLEFFANSFQDIQLLGSSIYPTNAFVSLGTIKANNSNAVQSFRITEGRSSHVRYLKIKFISHYESSSQYYYCTMTSFQVFGVRALEKLEREINMREEESKKITPDVKKTSLNVYANGTINPFQPIDQSKIDDIEEPLIPPELEDILKGNGEQPQHVFEKIASRLSTLEKVQLEYSGLLKSRIRNTLKTVHLWISKVNETIGDHIQRVEEIMNVTVNSVNQIIDFQESKIGKLESELYLLQIKYMWLEQYIFLIVAGLCVICIFFLAACICLFSREKTLSKRAIQWPKNLDSEIPKSSPDSPNLNRSDIRAQSVLENKEKRMQRRSSESFLKKIFSTNSSVDSTVQDEKKEESSSSTVENAHTPTENEFSRKFGKQKFKKFRR